MRKQHSSQFLIPKPLTTQRKQGHVMTCLLMKELGIGWFVAHGCGECVEDVQQECEDEAGCDGSPGWQHHIPQAALETHQGTHHIQESSNLAEHCSRAVRFFEANKQRLKTVKQNTLHSVYNTQEGMYNISYS